VKCGPQLSTTIHVSYLHTAGVAGSNPAPPTKKINDLQRSRALFSFVLGQDWAKRPQAARQLPFRYRPTPAMALRKEAWLGVDRGGEARL
jgi:hypothetical protein